MKRFLYPLILVSSALSGFFGVLYFFPLEDQRVRAPGKPVVIIQNPDLATVIEGPGKAVQVKRYITTTSSETTLVIEDISAKKAGLAMWIFTNIPPGKTHDFSMRVLKGPKSAPWSQLNMIYRVKKKAAARYSFMFKQGTGQVLPRMKTKKKLVSATRDGDYWLFRLKGKSPAKKSTLQVVLLPAVGKAPMLGGVEVQSIKITTK